MPFNTVFDGKRKVYSNIFSFVARYSKSVSKLACKHTRTLRYRRGFKQRVRYGNCSGRGLSMLDNAHGFKSPESLKLIIIYSHRMSVDIECSYIVIIAKEANHSTVIFIT